MACVTSISYVKKLVKIVYEKEKQMQNMRKAFKQRSCNQAASNVSQQIDPMIKKELEYASHQLKEVNQQLMSMEQKMMELEMGLVEQVGKNAQLLKEYQHLERKYQQGIYQIDQQSQKLSYYETEIAELTQQRDAYHNHQLQLTDLNNKITEKFNQIRQVEQRQRYEIMRYETQLNQVKIGFRKKISQSKFNQVQKSSKNQEIQLLKSQLASKQENVVKLSQDYEKLNQNYIDVTNLYSQIKQSHEQMQSNLSTKENQYSLLSEKLKDYEEFSLEISQYIESAHAKHCCQGMLRSSKKLMRETESCSTRFEAVITKMNLLQLWMDDTAQKVEKLLKQQELPNPTFQNLSIIAHSFQEKLDLCDLTQKLQRQKIEFDKNEQLLLDNLQKECQKSYQRQRSKLVELDQVREILKVTKQINRQLMDEINNKEYVISECRKLYSQLINGKPNPQYKNIKNLLNIKG